MTEENNVQQTLPRIGSPAPQFTAPTTHGEINLSDYEGKWVVLFSHPSDFTPVCTTEFVAFQGISEDLAALNAELIGLSIDSVPSHIAWVRNIEKNFDVKITFPVIADITMDVANKYGMIMPGESSTETSRAVFVIDDKQIVRAIIYYPSANGRNIPEVLRIVKALQTSDEHAVATPANWEPGERVIVPPAKTQAGAEERMNDDTIQCKDFYFCTKEI
ncbi:peroxiredoxin [Vagococcus humatus]|uniref:Peroxiredoxin n=1 Tax=Vagococcus humatus TaxID=1889241 RepID=A0A429Z9N0_9ENTE|nr:peroxiredoxin [Vagococcus humatus]RST90401.1 peroxiredoxin [Vagococcus humatus]